MAALPDLTVKFTADTAAFTAATQRMTREIEQTRRSMETGFAGMRTAAMQFATGLAGAFTLDRIIDSVISFGRHAVELAAGLDLAEAARRSVVAASLDCADDGGNHAHREQQVRVAQNFVLLFRDGCCGLGAVLKFGLHKL
jgi:zinc transporter ZupT